MRASQTQNSQRMSPGELGTWVALASFGMLFGTFLLSYLLAKARFPIWPPIGVEPVPVGLSTLSTAVIASSSVTLYLAQKALGVLDYKRFRLFWKVTIFLGIAFLFAQVQLWYALWNQGLRAQDHLFGGSVYVLTGLHALHLLAGVLGLVFVYFKTLKTNFRTEAPKNMGLIWHFLGITWVLMYLLLVIL